VLLSNYIPRRALRQPWKNEAGKLRDRVDLRPASNGQGAYFDTQTFIAPGTDLLADMIEINNAEGEP
jgi:hypothetical protein